MANLKKKIYENVCCFLVLLLVLLLVYLFATLTFAKSSPLFDFGPRNEDNSDLIHVKLKDPVDIKNWVKHTDSFLKDFLPNDTISRVACDFDDLPSVGRFCMMNTQQWPTVCQKKNDYGFRNGTPCIFLNLNPESGWLPDYFEKPNDLPKEMPQELKVHIESLHKSKLNQVWVSCVGKTQKDKDNIKTLSFVPWHGLPHFFYPARHNSPGYAKPLVVVHLEDITHGVDIEIECRAWAKNIPKGSQGVEFKVHIDNRS